MSLFTFLLFVLPFLIIGGAIFLVWIGKNKDRNREFPLQHQLRSDKGFNPAQERATKSSEL
ncbi:MAG: hypothetical protein LAT67_07965 [Balneolales bacterium]|nr:hypothetical protein [Balneolales bacterium]